MSCASQTNVVIAPGPRGLPGTDGTNGTDGVNAYTTTTAGFTMPAVSSTVSVSVGNTAWMAGGQTLYVQTAGYMTVTTITDSTTVVLTNLGYTGNASPTTSISTGRRVSAGGVKGQDGELTGTAGGDLTGSYPNPRLDLDKGELFTGTGASTSATLPVGSDGTILHANSAEPTGLEYKAVDLASSSVTGVLPVANGGTGGTLPIANGGTGQTTATAAFDALSPMTAQGDLIVGGTSGANTRLAISTTTGQVLTSTGSTAQWQDVSSSVNGQDIFTDSASGGYDIVGVTPSDGSVGSIVMMGGSGTLKLPSAEDFMNAGQTTGKSLTVINTGTNTLAWDTVDQGGHTVYKSTSLNAQYKSSIFLAVVISGGAAWVEVSHH